MQSDKIGKFWTFWYFWVISRPFSVKHLHLSVHKTLLNNDFSLERFHFLFYKIYWKFDIKSKNWLLLKNLKFLSTLVPIRAFFHLKTASISSKKPPWQQIQSLLNAFNISSLQVYREFNKSCKKYLKIGKFANFCHFWGLWGQPKNPKIFTNTYRMILILGQLNSMGEIL